MRFLLYNIRYATGGGPLLFPWSGYFRRTSSNLAAITDFIKAQAPDIVGLVEVDLGSYRSRKKNQAQLMAEEMGHYHSYSLKYGHRSPARRVPVMNKQGNAFLTRDSFADEQFHYFDHGVKRLVIELDLENLTVFLVHLALTFRVRQHQLSDLYSLVKATTKPHIVAGDFNAMWGDREIRMFLAATGLTNAGEGGLPSFPSWAPRRQLDFILYSRGIEVDAFFTPHVTYSDHLPLVCDFRVEGGQAQTSR